MRKERKLYDLKELGKAVSALSGDNGKSGAGTSVTVMPDEKFSGRPGGHCRQGNPAAKAGKGQGGQGRNENPSAAVMITGGLSGEADDSQGRMLRAGQRVVLMDSDVRGTVVELGRTVKVQTEDGLVLEAAYNEIVMADAEEELMMSGAVPKSPKPDLRHGKECSGGKGSHGNDRYGGRYSNNISVDLHIDALPGGHSVLKGHELEFQMDVFRRVIRDNLRHRGMRITFIHGVGDGTLRNLLRRELDEVFAVKCTWQPGAAGVTVVTIR